ncbi:MAG: 50S ribosomal protein L11 methyltransferase [Alphaproteobacteria bacterium]
MTQFRLVFTCTAQMINAMVDECVAVLEDADALSVGWYESTPEDLWSIEALFANQPDMPELSTRLALIAAEHNAPTPQTVCDIVDNTDWLEQTWRNFPPQQVERYYIYGSHYEGSPPADLLGIEMNAATAFGSGEHPTTQGCLQALDALAKEQNFAKALDMGCGSGILAIAIAKTWQAQVLAVDNDPESVRVTTDNAALNRCDSCITPLLSEGFADVSTTAYPLIVANILAKPLCSLAPSMAKNLAPGGIVILSGLLSWQAAEVLDVYRSVGLTHVKTYDIDNWTTLVLHKC